MKNTRSIPIADTVFFECKYITMPTISKADAIVTAATHMAQVLQEEPTVNASDTQPKKNQKIVALPMEPEVQQPCLITQDNVNIAQTPDQPANNTRAKWMTRTITQEFTLVMKECTVPRHISPTRDLKEYAGSILDEKMGKCLEYRTL